jgi:hypothetical protein
MESLDFSKFLLLVLNSNLSDDVLDQVLRSADLGIFDVDYVVKNSKSTKHQKHSLVA